MHQVCMHIIHRRSCRMDSTAGLKFAIGANGMLDYSCELCLKVRIFIPSRWSHAMHNFTTIRVCSCCRRTTEHDKCEILHISSDFLSQSFFLLSSVFGTSSCFSLPLMYVITCHPVHSCRTLNLPEISHLRCLQLLHVPVLYT